MRKKKELGQNFIILNNNVKISKEVNNELFFEIKNEVTTDIAEAVSMMMNMEINDIWDIEVEYNINNIFPERCLYWLSGGNKEWLSLDNYNRPWFDCYLDFQEEFGFMVIEIVKKSKKLGDIKNGFIKYLNLPTLYDFAISKGLVK
jgi:hypothetical protein